jgi:RNA polymerase sigma-70 factor (ECF subfamily)
MANAGGQEEFAALLERVRQGDAAALADLVKRYEQDILIAAKVRLGAALRPYLDPVDVVQSVHRSMISGLQKHKFDLSSPDKLIAVAVTLVQRKIARQWKRLKRQTRVDSGGSSAGQLRQSLLSLCSPEDDPGSAVRAAEAIDHFLSGLDDIDRRLLELRMEGFNTAQAAQQLGVDAGHLRVRLGRLRKAIVERGLLSDWL